MVKPDFTQKRDLTYSLWHRTIGEPYYMIDLDSVEWRGDRGIVAFIECAIFDPESQNKLYQLIDRKKIETKILYELQQLTRHPAFLVLHTPNLTTFWIFKIWNDGEVILQQAVGKEDYANWLRSL